MPTVQDAEELAVWLSERVLPQGKHVKRRSINAYVIWGSSRRPRIA